LVYLVCSVRSTCLPTHLTHTYTHHLNANFPDNPGLIGFAFDSHTALVPIHIIRSGQAGILHIPLDAVDTSNLVFFRSLLLTSSLRVSITIRRLIQSTSSLRSTCPNHYLIGPEHQSLEITTRYYSKFRTCRRIRPQDDCPENFMMVSLTVQELPCRQAENQGGSG